MKKIKLTLATIFTLVLTVVSIGAFNGVANAKMVVDDQGKAISVPDRYFTNQANKSLVDSVNEMCNKMLYYIDHPNETITDKAILNQVGNDKMQKVFDAEYLGRDRETPMSEIIADLKETYSQPEKIILRLTAGGLDVGGISLNNKLFNFILDPSDVTVYNATKQDNISKALQYSMDQWGQSRHFNFRMVNNPDEARIIVNTASDNTKMEKNVQGTFQLLSSYYSVEIQGQILLSPKIAQLSWDDPALLHTVMHEMGHAIGRPDLYD